MNYFSIAGGNTKKMKTKEIVIKKRDRVAIIVLSALVFISSTLAMASGPFAPNVSQNSKLFSAVSVEVKKIKDVVSSLMGKKNTASAEDKKLIIVPKIQPGGKNQSSIKAPVTPTPKATLPITAVVPVAIPATPQKTKPVSADPFGIDFKGSNAHYKERILFFESNLPPQGQPQFIGDSNTERMFRALRAWVSTADQSDPYYLYTKSFIDRYWDGGIAGDISTGVVKRLNLHLSSNPSELVVMIGTNDYNMQTLADNYRKIISRAQSAGTKIVMVSVLPRKIKNNKPTENKNSQLENICDPNGIELVNEYQYFVSEKTVYDDNLHLNLQGQKEFAKNFMSLHYFN